MAEINAEYKNFNKLNEELAKKNIKLFYIFNYDFYLNEKSIFVVTHNDEVYCFGYNIHGFLGFGHQKQIKEFTLNEDLSNKQIIQFIQGECHVFARTLNGNIYCWGKNEYGYFGNGSADLERIHKPGINGYLLNEHIKDISSGLRHTLILTSMGEVYAFGRNSFGQIGNHHNEDVYIPFKLNGFNGEKIKTISCGYHYSMALTQDGHVYSWGKNDSGQLGIGHTENTNSPQLILLDKNIIIDKISCGYAHTLLLSRESDVYVFGSNIYFQLGIEITSNKHLFPIKLNNEIKFSDIALHSLYHFSSALTANGIYYVWGKCGNINSKHCIKVPKETTFKSFQELLNHYMELTPKTWFYQSGKFNKLYSHQTKLGEGDYGVVYKANYIVMDEYFAIKKIQLYNTGADDFMKEINTALNSIIDLKSEYLIQYYDIWLEMDFKIVKESRIWDNNQSFYIQMELCDKSLPDFNTEIKVNSKLYLNNLFTRMGFYILGQITFQILQGVEYLHRNNIIHRDLKPDNILLKSGRIKVADFGLAKLIDNSKPNILNTGDIGNLKYMAPEVELSEYYDTKADVYSLGVILQELFEMEINNSIQYNSDVILKRKYVNIEALTEKMVNENPLERPDLQQILSETEKWCIYENEFNFDKELANIPENNYIQIIIRNIMSLKLYETYLGRFSTFKDWKNSYVKPEILAEKGFYFLGMDDRIKCVSCGNVWWGLDEGDQLKEFLHTSDCKYWRKSV